MLLNASALNTLPLNSTASISGDVAAEHSAGWRYELSVEHSSSWIIENEVWHLSGWVGEREVWHSTGWTALVALAAEHSTGWGFDDSVVAEHSTGWRLELAAEHSTAWDSTLALAAEHSTGWTSVVALAAEHALIWTAFGIDAIEAWHESEWWHEPLAPVDLVATPLLTVGSSPVGFSSIALSADESSPYWQAEIELARSEDYSRFPRDTAFAVSWFGVTFAFVVDTRNLERSIDDDGHLTHRVTVGGLSPLCMLDAPRATPLTKTWDEPTLASAIVEEVLGSVTWDLVDWTIPANRLSVDRAAPLAVARQIVEAAGGLIESEPGGGIVCRHRWPQAANKLSGGTTLSDRTIYSVSESPTQDAEMNRVRVLDAESTLRDSLEWVQDETDWRKGTLRAYPSPWRDRLALRTTRGTPPILLGGAVETVETQEPEIVEFREGSASVSRPIHTLVSVTWLIESLGAVSFAPYSTELVAATKGYALAEVVYKTRFLAAPGQSTLATSAQFLLEEILE